MWRMKKRNLVYWGVDYVRAYISPNLNNKNLKILKNLCLNSNQWNIEYNNCSLTIIKQPMQWLGELYSVLYDNISIAFFWFNFQNKKDFIEITWQWLTIFWEDIFYFLINFFNFNFIKFKRIDLCFDLELEINYFFEKILNKKYKEKIDWKYKTKMKEWKSPKNGLETLEIWDKNIKANSYSFIRIYNKILDSKKKWKLFLYEQYKNEKWWYKDITRFEIELREDLCLHYEYNFLKQYNFQFYRIVKSFYKFNVQFFKFLKDEDFIKFKKNYNEKNKSITEKIKNWILNIKTNTKSQDRAKKISVQKKLQEQFWTNFLNKEEEDRCISMFCSYGLRLLQNKYSYEQLQDILSNKFDKK